MVNGLSILDAIRNIHPRAGDLRPGIFLPGVGIGSYAIVV